MKALWVSLASIAALLLLAPAPVLAQRVEAQTVSACGTPNNAPVVGTTYVMTQDTTGKLCTSASASTIPAGTHQQCAALCTALVLKAAAGNLFSFEVSADSTLWSGNWYVMIFDATSAPADGAVTPAKCFTQISSTASPNPQMGGTYASSGVAFTTGITIAVSTTGCYSKTSSTHAFIGGDIQ